MSASPGETKNPCSGDRKRPRTAETEESRPSAERSAPPAAKKARTDPKVIQPATHDGVETSASPSPAVNPGHARNDGRLVPAPATQPTPHVSHPEPERASEASPPITAGRPPLTLNQKSGAGKVSAHFQSWFPTEGFDADGYERTPAEIEDNKATMAALQLITGAVLFSDKTRDKLIDELVECEVPRVSAGVIADEIQRLNTLAKPAVKRFLDATLEGKSPLALIVDIKAPFLSRENEVQVLRGYFSRQIRFFDSKGRKYPLVYCSNLSGMGKTTFGIRGLMEAKLDTGGDQKLQQALKNSTYVCMDFNANGTHDSLSDMEVTAVKDADLTRLEKVARNAVIIRLLAKLRRQWTSNLFGCGWVNQPLWEELGTIDDALLTELAGLACDPVEEELRMVYIHIDEPQMLARQASSGHEFLKAFYTALTGVGTRLYDEHHIVMCIIITGTLPYAMEGTMLEPFELPLPPLDPVSVLEHLQKEFADAHQKIKTLLGTNFFRAFLRHTGVVPTVFNELRMFLTTLNLPGSNPERHKLSGLSQMLLTDVARALGAKADCIPNGVNHHQLYRDVVLCSLMNVPLVPTEAINELRRMGALMGTYTSISNDFTPSLPMSLAAIYANIAAVSFPVMRLVGHFMPYGELVLESNRIRRVEELFAKFEQQVFATLRLRLAAVLALPQLIGSVTRLYPGLQCLVSRDNNNTAFLAGDLIVREDYASRTDCLSLSDLKLPSQLSPRAFGEQRSGIWLAGTGQRGWDILDSRFQYNDKPLVALWQAKRYSNSIPIGELTTFCNECAAVARSNPTFVVVGLLVSTAPLQTGKALAQLKRTACEELGSEQLMFFAVTTPEQHRMFALSRTDAYFL